MRQLYSFVTIWAVLTAPALAETTQGHEMHQVQRTVEATGHEMSHEISGHQAMPPYAGGLVPLVAVPASGRARESGMDGRHVLEATGAGASTVERCALASRGLVMLDNASWSACGGKVEGIPQTPAALEAAQTQRHMTH